MSGSGVGEVGLVVQAEEPGPGVQIGGDMLDEDTVPQNSDAVLILSQWQAALKQYKDRHYGFDSRTHRWFTVENPKEDKR